MEKLQGYDEAQAFTGEYEKIEPGAYICKIIDAKEEKSQSGRKMLVIAFDIAEGDHKDFYKRKFDSNKGTDAKWQGVYRQLLDSEKAASYLKGIMTSLEESNTGFVWNWDESKLKGLKFGGLFGREEYEKMDGTRNFATKLRFIRSVESVRSGKFEIPQDKLLPPKGDSFENDSSSSIQDDSDELPF